MGDSIYRRYKGRLAQYKKWENGPRGWHEIWCESNIRGKLDGHRGGHLGEYERVFMQYLPKGLPLLEAGCGPGQFVQALKARGFEVEGVDTSEETIREIQAYEPGLSVRIGDIYDLDVEDGYYGGYISLGILEHQPHSFLEGLKEAKRVLHPQGVALIEVPFLNAARAALLPTLEEAPGEELEGGYEFFQCYFSAEEFEDLLLQAGFEIVERWPHASFSGATRDYALGRWLTEKKFFHWRLYQAASRLCLHLPSFMDWYLAHMIMFVCK